MWAEPYNPLYVWGSCFHQIRTPFIQGGASVQQGLSAAFGFVAHDWHRGAADKRYSLAAPMANTQPTPVGFLKAVCLVWLLLIRPKRFLELQAEDSKALNLVTNPKKEDGAFVVRRAFFKSFLLVLVSGTVGYVAGLVFGGVVTCASANLISWLQVIGASVLLWGTLFIRGWEVQTYGGVTLTERVNQWIYRTLYCVGTAVLVCSLAWPTCNATKQQSTPDAQRAPTYDSQGWTQESTASTARGPWLDYDPLGTRYYRDAKRIIYRVYPPGLRPNAELANPFGLGQSTPGIPE